VKAWLKHPLRVTFRLAWLGAEFAYAALSYAARCAFRPQETLPSKRAAWLQYHARRVGRVFHIQSHVAGRIPVGGLLVSNHLSYLDILVIGAATPASFVAKSEVRKWPILGFFARVAGTIFVEREKRAEAGRAAAEIEAALRTGITVTLFPEGTSSGGETVLPFKSSLLEPATRQTHPLCAGLIQYELDDGDPGEEVCYWKDMTLVPHLVNLLSKRVVRAKVRFTQLRAPSTDRKELARQLHSEVLKLKEAVAA
jgi:1-acyl-sn-glycerol-3-phosphate acyltransferase